MRSLEDWITAIKRWKESNPEGPEHEVTGKFAHIDITGDAAIVKIELYRNSRHIYTDYLSLYKFNDGWKVVSKVYQRH